MIPALNKRGVIESFQSASTAAAQFSMAAQQETDGLIYAWQHFDVHWSGGKAWVMLRRPAKGLLSAAAASQEDLLALLKPERRGMIFTAATCF